MSLTDKPELKKMEVFCATCGTKFSPYSLRVVNCRSCAKVIAKEKSRLVDKNRREKKKMGLKDYLELAGCKSYEDAPAALKEIVGNKVKV